MANFPVLLLPLNILLSTMDPIAGQGSGLGPVTSNAASTDSGDNGSSSCVGEVQVSA